MAQRPVLKAFLSHLVVLTLSLWLAACSTADVLAPPRDIPGAGPSQASRVAPADPGMADPQAAYVPSPQNPMAAQEAAMQGGISGTSSSGTYARGPGAPPTTLEEQARRIGGPQPVTGRGGLYSMPGTQTGQQPIAGAGTGAAGNGMLTAPPAPAAASAGGQQSAALDPAAGSAGTAATTIRFLPIIGAPVQAVTPLSRQLGAEARARGLTIKSSSDPTSHHILKGYFSAFSNGGTATVTYVWDVLDASGNRLHRIQGQENGGPAGADPWASVPPSVMQTIATRTMDLYMAWLAGQSG